MPAVPHTEIADRTRALQGRLGKSEAPVDLAMIIQGTDLYYFSGTVQTGHLLVPMEGDSRLLIRKVLERARSDSPLDSIEPMKSLKALPMEIEKLCGKGPWRVGMELDVVPVNLLALYRRILGDDVEIVDISPDILAVRSVKSDWEIQAIRESGLVNDSLYRVLPEVFRPGMTTYELQSALNYHACREGHVGLIRMRGFNIDGLTGALVSGPTGSIPGHSQFPIGGHGPDTVIAHGGDHLPIEADVPIIFDYVVNCRGYHHDQTRMAVHGRFPDDARRVYEAMQEVLGQVESSLRPGAIPSAIYEDVLTRVADLGLAEGFLGPPEYAVSFVGHSLGLEVNEAPVLARKFDDPLVEGNTMAVEPKFTHPSYGVIGIENTFVIRANGAENLSTTPEEILELP